MSIAQLLQRIVETVPALPQLAFRTPACRHIASDPINSDWTARGVPHDHVIVLHAHDLPIAALPPDHVRLFHARGERLPQGVAICIDNTSKCRLRVREPIARRCAQHFFQRRAHELERERRIQPHAVGNTPRSKRELDSGRRRTPELKCSNCRRDARHCGRPNRPLRDSWVPKHDNPDGALRGPSLRSPTKEPTWPHAPNR